MERLTRRFSNGEAYIPNHILAVDGLQAVADKLADYEDIGLAAEQMKVVDNLYTELCKELGAYKKLEEQGMLIKLPFKIGDTVYCIHRNAIVTDRVDDFDIWSFRSGIHLRISLENYRDYIVGRFGEEVFLTQSEAEQALKQIGE